MDPANDRCDQRTRRSLLVAAVGGLAALAGQATGRPSQVRAAAGDPLRLGQVNTAGSTSTTVRSTSSGPTFKVVQRGTGQALQAVHDADGAAIIARGAIGVEATSDRSFAYGVGGYDQASHGIGVYGEANGEDGLGVLGSSTHTTGIGVRGQGRLAGVWGENGSKADGSAGIVGIATATGALLESVEVFGVKGISAGESTSSEKRPAGVYGEATGQQGSGVFGRAAGAQGVGIRGEAPFGTAGLFDGPVTVSGFLHLGETVNPIARPNAARLFARDDGAGKTQLCVRFATGVIQVIATEP